MRKHPISILPIITIVFAAFILGFFLGKNQSKTVLSVSVPNEFADVPSLATDLITEPTDDSDEITFPISINKSGKEELMALPGIGEVLAERIIDYRNKSGSFSAVEDLLNVEGVGKKRLEEIIDLITVGG